MTKTAEEILKEFMQALPVEERESILAKAGDLQRTDDWHEERRGMLTGSKFGDLMTCKSRAKGKDWGQKKWLLDFGDTAITYIIEKALERITGECIDIPFITWEMQYGIDHEEEGKDYFTANTPYGAIEEVGFTKFLKNAGASPDGKLNYNEKKLNFELKCPATIQSHYKLMTASVAEGHTYFWQLTGEMLALKVDKTIFVSYDKRYPEKYKLGEQMVHLSELHANALLFRCVIAEKLIMALEKDLKLDIRAELKSIGEEIPNEFDEWLEIELEKLKI